MELPRFTFCTRSALGVHGSQLFPVNLRQELSHVLVSDVMIRNRSDYAIKVIWFSRKSLNITVTKNMCIKKMQGKAWRWRATWIKLELNDSTPVRNIRSRKEHNDQIKLVIMTKMWLYCMSCVCPIKMVQLIPSKHGQSSWLIGQWQIFSRQNDVHNVIHGLMMPL